MQFRVSDNYQNSSAEEEIIQEHAFKKLAEICTLMLETEKT